MREFDLLQHVYHTSGSPDARVLIPPGDDMALVRLGGMGVLAAVDQLVAGRHVDPSRVPIELIGRKAVTRSLSDIAAMAGKPVASLAAVTLPPDFGSDRATALFDTMHETARSFDCPLIGGDIAIHTSAEHPLVCAVTVFAEPISPGPIRRSTAQPGDSVYVTGVLGGSLAPDGSGHHLTFTPRIAEALELLQIVGPRLHAMIDLSDGLGRDASHIATMSGVHIEIDAERIPCRADVDWKRAASDGEDYELLFTAQGDVPDHIGDDVPVTRIGRVVGRSNDGSTPGVWFIDGDERIDGATLGWEHHAPDRPSP